MNAETVIENETSEDVDLDIEEENGQEEESQVEGNSNEEPENEGSTEDRLPELLAKEKTDEELSDEELDILDNYHDGKLKLPGESKKEAEPKVNKKTEEKAEKEEEDPEPDKSSLDLQIMKEVGAKDKSEVAEKIKGLRQAISGKLEKAPEFQQVKADNKTLTDKINSEAQLMLDVKNGVPAAIEHLSKVYGLDLTAKGATPAKSENEIDSSELIKREDYVDEEVYNSVKKGFDAMTSRMDKLEGDNKAAKDEVEKNRAETSTIQAESNLVDEIAEVASQLPGVSKIKNIKEAIRKWRGGNGDSRLDIFNDFFLLANQKKVNLLDAYKLDFADKAALKINEARVEGKKEAYTQNPNRSLSGIQGSKGESENRQFTESQINEMEADSTKMPDSWFDDDDTPVKANVPKEAHKLFW
jgi:hypothetical protein